MITAALASAIIVGSLSIGPARAEAQCMPSPTCTRVSPDGKGIVGLGLIGAEIGFIVPALVQEAAGTNEWWPYLVFPVVGAAAGAIGGYFMEQETQNSPEVDVAFLAVGLALVVPTLVATLALTAYDPGQDAVARDDGGQAEEEPAYEDGTTTEAVQDEFGDEPAQGGEGETQPADEGGATEGGVEGGSTAVQRQVRGLLAGGPGILRFDGMGRQVLLGLPMVQTRSSFTVAESEALRLAPSTDVNVPVISGSF
ncbi:hypothetical protein [Sandaracinus amylolyticus]|uniref:hypothetical protein n=1 Tax=Sandaracinus amylolyticus TaxID=927083 RepID=UPI001F2E753D|nr:hypothetical protein [Sandaracinus amylolyticus]